MDPSSLAIFELPDPIREPFTLNILPIWERGAHNNYLLIDEIAYIGLSFGKREGKEEGMLYLPKGTNNV
jgi:hypothetical protein